MTTDFQFLDRMKPFIEGWGEKGQQFYAALDQIRRSPTEWSNLPISPEGLAGLGLQPKGGAYILSIGDLQLSCELDGSWTLHAAHGIAHSSWTLATIGDVEALLAVMRRCEGIN